MESKKRLLLIISLVILVGLQSCTSIDNAIAATKQADTPVQVNTPLPQKTSTFTTPKPSPTAAMLLPTLTSSEKNLKFEELFAPDTLCNLPCWQGIIPGETAESDKLESLFANFGSRATIYPPYLIEYKGKTINQSAARIFYDTGTDIEIEAYIEWYSKDKHSTIDMFRLIARIDKKLNDGSYESIFGNETYNYIFRGYRLREVLSTYGIPASILVFAELTPIEPLQENEKLLIRLFYPENGIQFKFTLPLNRSGNVGIGCPKDALSEWWAMPPNTLDEDVNFQSYVEGYSDAYSVYLPITDINQTSITNFYTTFVKSEEACIEVPLELWPGYK